MRDEHRRRAIEGLATARAALGRPVTPPPAPPVDGVGGRPRPADRPVGDRWSPDRVAAELAEGALRDELMARVARLEDEVEQLKRENGRLRQALATVMEAAAGGLGPSAVLPDLPPTET